MKQTILTLFMGFAFFLFTCALAAQTPPQFQEGAYQIIENASHTHFDWTANENEYLSALESWKNCGPNIHILGQKTEFGYHVEMIVDGQTGPEYVAKLMSVVGITTYTFNGISKEISQLEFDLQVK